MELLTVRLEWTLSGSVLAFILCSPHKDRNRKEIPMPIIFHCAQNFLSLVILPILALIQIALLPYDRPRVVFQQLQSPNRGRARESHLRLTLIEQAAWWYEAQVGCFRIF